jgi:hypothetical protein
MHGLLVLSLVVPRSVSTRRKERLDPGVVAFCRFQRRFYSGLQQVNRKLDPMS